MSDSADSADSAGNAGKPASRVRKGRQRRPLSSWRDSYLDAFKETCNVTYSCKAAGISPQTLYRAQKKSGAFKAQCEDAREQAVDRLEEEAWKRATEGNSDKVLIFLLEAHRPQRYGRRQKVELTGSGGGPIQLDQAAAREQMRALSSDPEAMAAMRILSEKMAEQELERQGVQLALPEHAGNGKMNGSGGH